MHHRADQPLLSVAWPPHAHSGRTVKGLMFETLLALMPAAAFAIGHYGVEAMRVMCLSMFTAVVAEALCLKIMGRPQSADNGSALTAGLLFGMLLPASAPWWLVICGCMAGMVIGRMVFGGLGASPLCTPLVGWAVARISWPGFMDTDLTMLNAAFTSPLADLKNFGPSEVNHFTDLGLLMGEQLGGLGSAQAGAVLVGGLYLLVRRRITWHIPVSFIIGLAATAAIFLWASPDSAAPPLFHLLTGSSLFGAFFLATDTSSSPRLPLSMCLFGLLAGSLVILIRYYGIYHDGVPFAVLLANLFTPLLDKLGPRPWGRR